MSKLLSRYFTISEIKLSYFFAFLFSFLPSFFKFHKITKSLEKVWFIDQKYNVN